MIIAATYSFNRGAEMVRSKYPHLLQEIEQVVAGVDAERCKVKASREKTMMDRLLYSPRGLNQEYKRLLIGEMGWKRHRVACQYSTDYYCTDYRPKREGRTARPYREMDYLKEGLGVEVQFGKYSFMVYNVAAKMTIFHNLGYIDTGVEVVPVRDFAAQMSTGVSYFEQFVWDLETRGVADIDIPVLVLGVDS